MTTLVMHRRALHIQPHRDSFPQSSRGPGPPWPSELLKPCSPQLIIIVVTLDDRRARSHGGDRRGHRGDPGNARHQRRVETNRRKAKVLTDPVRVAGRQKLSRSKEDVMQPSPRLHHAGETERQVAKPPEISCLKVAGEVGLALEVEGYKG